MSANFSFVFENVLINVKTSDDSVRHGIHYDGEREEYKYKYVKQGYVAFTEMEMHIMADHIEIQCRSSSLPERGESIWRKEVCFQSNRRAKVY